MKIFEAWNRHDLEAFMSHFSDDLKVVWPSERTVDKEGLRRDLAVDVSAFQIKTFVYSRTLPER